jgi:hypothetical protein
LHLIDWRGWWLIGDNSFCHEKTITPGVPVDRFGGSSCRNCKPKFCGIA